MKYNKKSESGKTITELLGVLVIMAIFGLGTLKAYRYGMDRMAANNIMDGVRRRAVVASQQRIRGSGKIDLFEFDNREEGTINNVYPITVVEDLGMGYFGLQFEGVSLGICTHIYNRNWQMPSQILLNDKEITDTACAEENKFLFVFPDTLERTADNWNDAPSCSIGSYIVNGTCTLCPAGSDSFEPNATYCACKTPGAYWNGTQCVDGSCLGEEDISGADTWSDGYIVQCQSLCSGNQYYDFGVSGCERPTEGNCIGTASRRTAHYSATRDADAQQNGLGTLLNEEQALILSDRFVVLDTETNWWSARAHCMAKSLRLASLSDIGCADYGKDTMCQNAQKLQALMSTYASRTFWLNNPEGSGTCSAYAIDTNNGIVRVSERDTSHAVLCVR